MKKIKYVIFGIMSILLFGINGYSQTDKGYEGTEIVKETSNDPVMEVNEDLPTKPDGNVSPEVTTKTAPEMTAEEISMKEKEIRIKDDQYLGEKKESNDTDSTDGSTDIENRKYYENNSEDDIILDGAE